MTLRACSRQPEVQQLLADGHWPHACPPNLRSHIDACQSCHELLLVTHAFQRARAVTAAQAQLPAPGAIWWRAQLRRRNAAIERATKPLAGAYLFALTIAIFAGAALILRHASNGFNWLSNAGQTLLSAMHLPSLNSSAWLESGWGISVLVPFLATLVLLAAAAVYFVVAEKEK